uniref:Uncharacterized protein n=1 Tax=Anguilla anguilla TaxID=7936 RepID=A0A0E9QT56_ANGAN
MSVCQPINNLLVIFFPLAELIGTLILKL